MLWVDYNGRGENPFLMFEGHPGVEIEFLWDANIANFESYLKIRPKISKNMYFYMKSYICRWKKVTKNTKILTPEMSRNGRPSVEIRRKWHQIVENFEPD